MNNPLPRRRLLSLAALSALAVPLAACTPTESSVADQAKKGDGKGYIAGDGTVQEYAPDQRSEPVNFSATSFDGTTITTADWDGKVTVLNFWYAACAPCRLEAPTLKKLSEEFKKQGVQFIGVNVRDEKAAADAFDKTFGLEYPSINDLVDGGVQLALAGIVPAQAVPTTLVIGPDRRVTSRVLGVTEESTLRSLIKTALDQGK